MSPHGKFASTNQKHYTQIRVVTRHQYGISALVSQTSFRGETSGSRVKCRLFSQAIINIGVVIATKRRNYYLFHLQLYFSALEIVLPKLFTGTFASNSRLHVREV